MVRLGKLRTWIELIYSLYKNEFRNLKPTKTIIRRGLIKMKIRGDKPIGVIMHIYT
jgi:hypothetical protein